MTFDEIVDLAIEADASAQNVLLISDNTARAQAHSARAHSLAVLAQAVMGRDALAVTQKQIQRALDSADL